MKHAVVKFKSLEIVLRELEPFVRNGQHLLTGRPFNQFGGMRSREMLANWLICVVANKFAGDHSFVFTSDPVGGDGIIVDERTGETWPTEHVLAYHGPKHISPKDDDDYILQQIEAKLEKGGASYAEGKTLIVMAEGIGAWNPTQTAKRLPKPLHFDAVWTVALHAATCGMYQYDVARLDLSRGAAPVWRVSITSDFNSWTVEAHPLATP